MSPREVAEDERDQAATELAEPIRYAVAIFFEGSLMCVCNGSYTRIEDAMRKRRDKIAQLPSMSGFEVRIYRREITWTEEAA